MFNVSNLCSIARSLSSMLVFEMMLVPMNAAAPTAKIIMHIIAVVFHVKPLENSFQTEEAES
jgi:hypothetical protein